MIGGSRLLVTLPRVDRFGLAFLAHLWLTVLRQAVLNSRAKACWTEVKLSRLGRVEGVQIGHPAVTAGDRAQWRWGTLTGRSTAHRLYHRLFEPGLSRKGHRSFVMAPGI
jgi:hypothetical protein